MKYQEIIKVIEEAVKSLQELDDQIAELSTQKAEAWQAIEDANRRYNTVSRNLLNCKADRNDLSKAFDALRFKLKSVIDEVEE